MYPHLFEEELGSSLHCDSLLAGGHNHHLRKLINNHKTQSFIYWAEGNPDMYSIEMDSQGLLGVLKGVYMPCALMAGSVMA
jgi:hypothetical protein